MDKSLNITASSIGAAASNHNHDNLYSKLSHTHLRSHITDFPTSLPANGGNADTVGGSPAWRLQSLNAGGESHGPNTPWDIIVRHNVNNDDRFFIKTAESGHQISVHHSLYSDRSGNANNADRFGGLEWNHFVSSVFWSANHNNLSINPDRVIISDVEPQYSPTGTWAHFISMPHRSMNYHTAQIYVPFFNNPTIYARSAPGGDPNNAGIFSQAWMSHYCNAVLISGGAPNDGRLLWAW